MELRAEEIRIGNWVLMDFENVYEQVTPRMLSFMCQANSKSQLHPFKPIPLTEEILLKIEGIEKLDNSEWEYILKISASKLYFRFNAGYCYTQFNDTYLGGMISCLHKLQNFCSVFKKELNVKL